MNSITSVPRPSTDAKTPGRIRVAIVEDDPGTRSSLRAIIARDSGIVLVGEFGSVRQALEELPGSRPGVVLMDINLPDGTGIDCVRRLSPAMPSTEFVMLTLYHDGKLLFDALAAGAHGYLIKPVRVEALLAAIRDVVAGGAPMSSMVARRIVQTLGQVPQLAASVMPVEEDDSVLAPREREVLDLLSAGAKYKEIASRLSISQNTVMTYMRRIYKKLHVNSRHFAVERYRRMQ